MQDWVRVTNKRKCPICGKPDWCLIHTSGALVICPRTESEKYLGEAGYLHATDGTSPIKYISGPTKVDPFSCKIDVELLQQALPLNLLVGLAKHLGLTTVSIERMGIGWHREQQAFAFPMQDGLNRVIGIRLRSSNGDKWALRGSRSGLFVPEDLAGTGELYVAEGPTDTAALLDLGLDAIGRPSCMGGADLLLQKLGYGGWTRVIVVSDADDPGVSGACSLGNRLASVGFNTVVVVTPKKDVRAWVNSGATRDDVIDLVRRYTERFDEGQGERRAARTASP